MKRLTIALLALLFAAGTASAQGRPNQPRRPNAEKPPIGVGELLNMLDAYAVVQAQDVLKLTDAQFGDFVGRLKKLQQTRRRNLQVRNQMLAELRRMTNAPEPPEDGAIKDRLKQIRDHDERSAGELKKAYETLDEALTPLQQARFRLFEELLERRKVDLLMRARRGASDEPR